MGFLNVLAAAFSFPNQVHGGRAIGSGQQSGLLCCDVLSSCVVPAVCLALSRVAVPCALLAGGATEVFQEEVCSLPVVLKLQLKLITLNI